MAHNVTYSGMMRRLAFERQLDDDLRVEGLIARGATVTAKGRSCKHTWNVDLRGFASAGLSRLSLRWEHLPCPICKEVCWPTFTVHA